MHRKKKLGAFVVLGLFAAALIGVLISEPYDGWPAQDPSYHEFADGRAMASVPNLLNVLSNLPFLFTGVLGLIVVVRTRARDTDAPYQARWERHAFIMFFIGVTLTCFGSSYYHYWPSSSTLFWDRLPMTFAFMALFAIVIGERIYPAWGRRALWPLVLFGAASVVFWHLTEQRGMGDLRPYALVQFFPLVTIPILLLMFAPPYTGSRSYWRVSAWYVVAKGLELADQPIYEVSAHVVSGHSLKHVAAAVATYWLYRMLLSRRPLGATG